MPEDGKTTSGPMIPELEIVKREHVIDSMPPPLDPEGELLTDISLEDLDDLEIEDLRIDPPRLPVEDAVLGHKEEEE